MNLKLHIPYNSKLLPYEFYDFIQKIRSDSGLSWRTHQIQIKKNASDLILRRFFFIQHLQIAGKYIDI